MNKLLFAFVLTISCGIRECKSRAHHKVHNLALYPDRHSWCQVTPIRQEIAAPDSECTPATIDNAVCLGACFSYTVPRVQDDEAIIPPYCDACRVTKSKWTVISLNCTRTGTGEHYYHPKNVELISNCSCVDCNDNSPRDDDDDSSGDDSGEAEELESHEASAFNTIQFNSNHINQLDEEEAEEEEEPVEHHKQQHHHHHESGQPPVPGPSTSIHNIKSASAEQIKSADAEETDAMIKENKISPDDDEDTVVDHSRHGHGHRQHG